MAKKKQLPRGLRNNNPLNIRKGAQRWQGQTGNDGAFCIFESMEYGYRAAFRLLHTYNNVSSTNSKQCKLCVHNSFTCNAWFLWEEAVSG